MFKEFLAWLTGPDGGSFILVSWGISWGLEDFAWWQGLPSKGRSLIILGISLVLGVASVWLQGRPELVAAIEPYFRPVAYAIGAWLATQTAHRLNSLRVARSRG